MKKIVILSLFCIFTTLFVHAQTKPHEAILGTWLTGTGNARVEIIKNGSSYQGKIVWLKEPIEPETGKPKTDTKHPDASNHNRPLLGLTNLWGFQFNESNNSWENGHIYDPKNGKEYKSIITLKDKNTLHVRGYIGISLIGRTDVWTKVK
jgi:uncharacterized protein (DUF2147 family)